MIKKKNYANKKNSKYNTVCTSRVSDYQKI